MNIKPNIIPAFLCCLTIAATSMAAFAQTNPLPRQEQEHILVTSDQKKEGGSRSESLSGINLLAGPKGTFQLDFSQDLDENAMLQITDAAGKLVFNKPISIANNQNAWRYNVGKLKPSVYLVEVKTSDTTYWTKFKVGN
ncbi:T9SS type A sorting domain-containing protein [Pontibacter sp. MBLB2868]|uniref:T9SS type A sorting domain-containing protein n=1 Tax=Pontibacter sp. MBLB2868 TaxID=3451555 RepID=UPI003F74E586